MKIFRSILVFILCFFAIAGSAALKEEFPAQISVTILQSPTPMNAQGKNYLVYELYVSNFYPSLATITSLDVGGSSAIDKKFTFKDQDLIQMIRAVGVKEDKAPLAFLPGVTKIIYVWLPYDSLTMIPNQIVHRFSFNTTHDNNPISVTFQTDPLVIKKMLPVVIGPPLRGDYWVAGGGPSNKSDHRRAHMVIHGHDFLAQRYAIDFIRVDESGQTYAGDEHNNQSYYAYGKEVVSVAPGKVIEVRNDIPENIPHTTKMAVPITLETVGGNYALIDIGRGYYAFYAHMQPGSITVKPGDAVRHGQVLGKLGNSGNSSEPHLHFHVVNNPYVLAADGVPYAFDNFYVRNSRVVSEDPFKIEILGNQIQHYINQLVLENVLLKFPD